MTTIALDERNPTPPPEVPRLLERAGLRLENDLDAIALAYSDGKLVGCVGLSGDLVKCTVVDEAARGRNLLGRLLTELRQEAIKRGQAQLYCYTTPTYRDHFGSLGFRALAEVPGLAVLLEDDPEGMERHLATLSRTARPGREVGGVVLNANPFTLGHEHLIRAACAQCDVVHVFVVGEERSLFTYAERRDLVKSGVDAMPEARQVLVQPGSRYVVSQLTFPQYFLKDQADLSRAHAGIDLQVFREHIAPALGIRHRFIGSEPASAITALYNSEMSYWLQSAPSTAPRIAVHEIPRLRAAGDVVSASRVRALLAEGRLDELRPLVPPTTFDFLARRQRADPK